MACTDPQKRRDYRRAYEQDRYKTDPEYRAKRAAKAKDWYQSNRSRILEKNKIANCSPARRATRSLLRRKWRHKLRLAAFAVLGGKCTHCLINDERVLEIDHINGDGSLDRRARSIISILRKIADGVDTASFQLLCANCHKIKHHVPLPPV